MHKKQTIVVTGASVGIGQAIGQVLLAQGYSVVNLARRPAAFGHAELSNYEVDLSDKSAVADCAKIVAAEHNVTGVVVLF